VVRPRNQDETHRHQLAPLTASEAWSWMENELQTSLTHLWRWRQEWIKVNFVSFHSW
jgi:hypothetical protein